jgi:two-component system, chemotaxis family, CheB/CheR fusion protein
MDASRPYVVGIGASAGGIEALKEFFRAVAPDSGAAYVVILHLSPDHDSQLAQVLQHAALIPVTQVTEQVRLEADHVYVVPPNKILRVDGDSIVVEEMAGKEERRAPVDMFFRSLADSRGARAACVVLSGTGPNGSAGLKRVKEYGGLVVVQDPETARYADMPRNSIATGLVDLVLPVTQIPGRIREYRDRQLVTVDLPTEAAHPEALREILRVLRVRTGHDFSNYKPGTIQRRVERRVHLLGLSDAQAYAKLVRENPPEALALMKELLISVTHFFRDPAAFDALNVRILPRLVANKERQDQIRVWVPGCATGEEAYSIAMLLAEHAGIALDRPAAQVFATDLDEQAIAAARDAFYTNSDVADVSEERLLRFFIREPAGYRVRRDLRETVLFAVHNVIRDPPFSHLDLISCRNLLIYLNRPVQERVIETFHFALRPGGFLFLGPSESPETPQNLFASVETSAHIYESRIVSSRLVLPPVDQITLPPRLPARAPDARPVDRVSPGDLHQRLLERYAPPSLVVTEDHLVVHLSERVGRFLQVLGGEPTRDLMRMVRPDLRGELRTALHQATLDRQNVEIREVLTALDDGEHRVDICVYPVLREDEPARGYLLVTFDARPAVADTSQESRQLVPHREPLAQQLEEEMSRLKQQLRATVEQYETQAEEAKASNEELQAMNEELRSSAEELETSKEELQSVNEELTTVNQELKIKIEELGLANNDFQNLINSSDIGTIFLDRRLQVKLFTPAASQVFNLLRSDLGRPLSDITTTLVHDRLFDDVQRVLDELRTVDAEYMTRDGRWIMTRLRPYRTTDDHIDGVVITLHDVTDRRKAEDEFRRGEERLRLLIDGALDYAIFTMNDEGVIDLWNPGAERMFGYRADEIVGRHVEVLFTTEDRAADVPRRELRHAREHGRAADERFHVRKNGSRFYCSGTTIKLGEAFGFAKIARDLSTHQQAAEALRLVQADFDVRVRERTDALEAEVSARAAAHHHVTVLLQRIVTAQEDERARIARDLHDHLGQQLTALRLTLQGHRDQLGPDHPLTGQVVSALSLAQRIDDDLDFLAWELRPAALDDHGLAAALPVFVREWSEHYKIPVEYRAKHLSAGQLARDAEVVFYRVAQESLNNVLKHAHATRVDVLVERRDGAVRMVIEDNGVGFDLTEKDETRDKGIGIIGMHERAALIGGTLQIESQPGQGTSVYLEAPASQHANPED